MFLFIFLCLSWLISFTNGLNNGLGLTPQMGWNGWNQFHCNINENIIKNSVDAIVASGLADAGYQYINLDDCWQSSRDANGTIQADPINFPSGMPALIDYVHSKKLKFGLYSDRGNMTCQHRPGSLHYETKDADTYAAWGVDYLKLDSCNLDDTPAKVEIAIMRDALNATGRPIFFSLCGGVGGDDPSAPSLGNSWRTTNDILNYWSSILANIDHNERYAATAGVGGWNDPDMLAARTVNMTDAEYRSHLSLWSISKAPLIIGSDITNMSSSTLSILTNPEVIAVNQDKLGIQGKKIAVMASSSSNASKEVFVANLSLPDMDPKRYQWTYNEQDGSIRLVYNGRCLSIDQCSTERLSYPILDECQIGDPHALCQGKNQQWTYDPSAQTIVSRMTGNCLGLLAGFGPGVESFTCENRTHQYWIWNATNGTFQSVSNHLYLSARLELEIWSGSLFDGSQAVLLFNRGENNNEQITVNWTDISFPADHPANVRDIWTRKDLGVFTGSFTSSNIDSHGVMMLNITLTK